LSAWKCLLLHTKRKNDEEAALVEAVKRDNVMIKVPGTAEGLPAIRQLIGEASTSTSPSFRPGSL